MIRVINLCIKMFIIYVLTLKIKIKILINLLNKITILLKYSHYAKNFLSKFTVKFAEYNNNDYVFKLKKDKYLLYNLISSLRLMEIETLKVYIKTNLTNNFI